MGMTRTTVYLSQDAKRRLSLAARRRTAGGLTDAVNAVLAERYETDGILTTDQRHFRTITPLTRRFDAFRLLPFDRQGHGESRSSLGRLDAPSSPCP